MTPEEELARKRSAALWEFLESNSELFCVRPEEDVEMNGPEIITGAYLIVRGRDVLGEGELRLTVCAPFALGMSEKIGLVECARRYFWED
jgi:hypothetical protein